MTIYLYVIMFIVAFGGLAIANLIHHKKKFSHPLVCPVGTVCDPVIYSKYSQLFNIPVETIGAIYYTIITLTYAVFHLIPELHSAGAALVLLELTTVAFLFSVYLTSIQAFVLKQWCSWCLVSAALCAAIFLIEFWYAGFFKVFKVAPSLLGL